MAGDGDPMPVVEAQNHVIELGEVVESHAKKADFVLSFRDLTYRVKVDKRHKVEDQSSPEKRRAKTLLDSISGDAGEGEVMAVLGASGCGKSTLLDALAGRISRGSLQGSVHLNGEPVDGKLLRSISAYVMQDDLLFPMLTVEETLMYAAEFRLPATLSAERKRGRVSALIDQLGLRGAAGTIIGDEGHRGVSGGERRRVSIGIDIIHDPIILFLDEPTSGLDSTSAFRVMEVLRRVAVGGSIVVATIHQPSSRIINLLDRLLLLSGGRAVFSGTPSDLQPYFTAFGRPIPDNEGHTDFALDLIRDLEEAPGGVKALVDHCKAWPSTSVLHHIHPQKEAIAGSVSSGKLVAGASGEVKPFANSFWKEMGIIARRSFTNTRRQPDLFAYRLTTVLVTGFILATVYWQLDATPRGVTERLGFFAFAMSVMFYTCGDALPVFLHERYVFLRETAHNTYRRSSYVCANAIAALPALAVLSLAFVATTFYSVGLAGGLGGMGFFLLMVFASFWAGNSFVTFLSGVVPSVMVGFTVVVATLAYYLLVSGFFIAKDRIPVYWMWFHYLSLVKYPYEGVMRNEFGDATRCFARGVEVFDGTQLGSAAEGVKKAAMNALRGVVGMNVTAGGCLLTGPEVLKEQGIDGGLNKWGCLLVTVAWGFFFRWLFYVALLVGSRNKRR